MSVGHEDYTEYDWFGEARVQETSGDLQGAMKAFEESIKLNPKFAKAWYYKAILHYHLGEMSEAAKCAKKVMQLNPSWEKHLRKNMPNLKF
ncbi:MAG: tetratricopeptide repeat protein [Candidatus Thorarchaeota archaeon]